MLNEKLKQARKNKGFSQTEIAQKLGFPSTCVICRLEKGHTTNPRFKIMCDLSDILGISLDEIKAWSKL